MTDKAINISRPISEISSTNWYQSDLSWRDIGRNFRETRWL